MGCSKCVKILKDGGGVKPMIKDPLYNLYIKEDLGLNLDRISQEEAEEILNEILDDSADKLIEPDTLDGKGFFEV